MVAGNHRLTFGTHGERIDLVDDVVTFPAGVWFFDSLDSLEQGEAGGLHAGTSPPRPTHRWRFA